MLSQVSTFSGRPANVARAQAPQFGWTKQNPPEYRLELRPEDFANQRKLIPSDEWIEKAADMLIGESDNTPRFFCIPNITDYTRDPEQIREFQTRLLAQVAERLYKTNPEFFHEFNGEDVRFVKEQGWVIHQKELNGAKKYDNKQGRKNHGGGGVYTKLHADSQNWPLFAISYGPYKNIRGGMPVMADMRQLARDTDRPVEEATDGGMRPNPEDVDTIRARYMAQVRPQDFDPVNGIPIVVFNNLNWVYDQDVAGVFHGATQVSRRDGNNPDKVRPLFKVALAGENPEAWSRNEECVVRKG